MIKPIFESIPDEIKAIPQWILWREEPRKDNPSKMTKPPYQPNGQLAESDNPLTWNPFATVKAAAPRFDGVGFVLTQDDPFVGLDFDNCRCPAFDGLTPWANSLDVVLPDVTDHIRNLNSYTERSPSGRGIRVFVKGILPVDGKKKGGFEAYQARHYMTMTGHVLNGFPRTIEKRQNELDEFYQAVFSEPTTTVPTTEGEPLSTPPADLQERLEKAFKSRKGEKIHQLYNGDTSGYSSPSEADLALVSHLYFWLSGDAQAIDAAFRVSGLYRSKWDEQHYGNGETYGQHIIRQALKDSKNFYIEEGTEQKTWGDPIPLNDFLLLPRFPTEMIPGAAGEMVKALTDSCQVDPGLPGGMMLAALSTAIGGKIKIDLRSHAEPGNLFTIAVIGPGNRKTETAKQVAAPIYVFQKE